MYTKTLIEWVVRKGGGRIEFDAPFRHQLKSAPIRGFPCRNAFESSRPNLLDPKSGDHNNQLVPKTPGLGTS